MGILLFRFLWKFLELSIFMNLFKLPLLAYGSSAILCLYAYLLDITCLSHLIAVEINGWRVLNATAADVMKILTSTGVTKVEMILQVNSKGFSRYSKETEQKWFSPYGW